MQQTAILNFILLIFLLGCGGGNTQEKVQKIDTNLTKEKLDDTKTEQITTKTYSGKTDKAILTKENEKEYFQAIVYLNNLLFSISDLYVDEDNYYDCITLDDDRDSETKLGKIEDHYKDCKLPSLLHNTNYDILNTINGTRIKEFKIFDASKMIMGNETILKNFSIVSKEHNITINLKMSHKNYNNYIDDSFEIYAQEYNFEYFIIDDHNSGRQIAFENLRYYESDEEEPTLSAKVFVDNEGYIDLTSKQLYVEPKYLLQGENDININLKYGYDDILQSSFGETYFIHGVTLSEKLKPVFTHISLYEDISAKFDYTNKMESANIQIKWYVNNSYVANDDKLLLSSEYFKKADIVKVEVSATDGGEIITQTIEHKIRNKPPRITYLSRYFTYTTDKKELEFDIVEKINLSIFDEDQDPLTYTWEVYNTSDKPNMIEIIETTKHSLKPSILIKEFNLETEVLKLTVSDGDDNTTEYFNVIFEQEFFKFKNIATYESALYKLGKAVVADINKDGHNDIICPKTPTADNIQNKSPEFVIFFQNEDKTFTHIKEIKIPYTNSTLKALYPADFNADGLIDFVLKLETDLLIIWQQNNGDFSKPELLFSTENELSNVNLAYLNNDNLIDIAVTNMRSEDIELFLQTDSGFKHETIEEKIHTMQIHQMHIADINGDNKNDIIITSKKGFTSLVQNNNFQFNPFLSELSSSYMEPKTFIVDINNDGYNDLIYTEGERYYSNYTMIYFGTSQTSLSNATKTQALYNRNNNMFQIALNGIPNKKIISFDTFYSTFTIYNYLNNQIHEYEANLFSDDTDIYYFEPIFNTVRFDSDENDDIIIVKHTNNQSTIDIMYTK